VETFLGVVLLIRVGEWVMPIKVLTFNKISDPNELFYAEPNEVPNIRLAGGGIKVLSGGVWTNVTPYQPKPSTPSAVLAGRGFIYKNGIIINIDDGANGYLVQIDNRRFVLFRCIRGNTIIPIIDDYNREHNGIVSDNQITLSPGQYALFYTDVKPSLGNYLTADVEQGSGLKYDVKLMDGTTITAYANFGYGEAKRNLDTNDDNVFKYMDGVFRPPPLPRFIELSWRRRSYGGAEVQHVHLAQPPQYTDLMYLDDPNVTTNKVLDIILRAIYVDEDSDRFAFAYEMDMHDSDRVYRFTMRGVVEYKQDTENDAWRVKVLKKINTVTDCYVFDEGGATTGTAIRFGLGKGPEDADHDLAENYYAYNPSTGQWESLTFVSNYWTWRTGYRAVRVHGTYYGSPVYVYMRFIAKAGTLALSTYKHSRWYETTDINMYWNELGDRTIPANSVFAWGVEALYAKSDMYDPSPSPEDDYGTDTAFIDQYFQVKRPTILTLQITPL